MANTKKVNIKGCNECNSFYLYTREGSFCKHPTVKKIMKGKNGLISYGFVDRKFPDWCPLNKK